MTNKIILTNDGSNSIFNTNIKESYHSKHGAIVEAEHVFIKHGFSSIKKDKISILEVGFGTGLNALLTLQKSIQKKILVNYHTIEPYPINRNIYQKLNYTDLIGVQNSMLIKLHASPWNKKNKINNYFYFKKINSELINYKTKTKFDIIYFDAFSPDKQPEIWNIKHLTKMYNYLNDDGFLVTYCAKGVIKRNMRSIGFQVIVLDGPPGKRQMTKAKKISNF